MPLSAHQATASPISSRPADKGVADPELRRKLENSAGRHLDHVAHTRAEFPRYDEERDTARRIKEEAIGRLDELLIELKQQLEANGCKVFVAADAAEARDYIVEVALPAAGAARRQGQVDDHRGDRSQPRARSGRMEVVETDLGEYIVQLRHERPSHIMTPAIHLSKEDIGTAVHRSTSGIPYTAEPERLTAAAREQLALDFPGRRPRALPGVNFAIAETGTLVLIENEGNGRLCSTLPDTFIAVMGIEKVIPRLADLSHFLEILARTGTGQKLTTYTNFISGPRGARRTRRATRNPRRHHG